MKNKLNNNKKDESVKQFLEGFYFKSSPKNSQQGLVEILSLAGKSVAEIAQVLNTSEEAIKGNLEQIWRSNPKKYRPQYRVRITKNIDFGTKKCETVKYDRSITGIYEIKEGK
jgi:hypothetical protein